MLTGRKMEKGDEGKFQEEGSGYKRHQDGKISPVPGTEESPGRTNAGTKESLMGSPCGLKAACWHLSF